MQETHIIPHTMAHVFPYVDQFKNEALIASNQSIHYDRGYMGQSADSYANLTRELYGPDRMVTFEPLSMLSLFLRDQTQILKEEEHTQMLLDMDPRLEYYFFLDPTKKEIHTDSDTVESFRDRIKP